MTSEEPVKETWSSHLKDFAKKNDVTYRVAMSNPTAKLEWAKKRVPKAKAPKKEKVVKPKAEPKPKKEKVVKPKAEPKPKKESKPRVSNKAKKEALKAKKEALEKLK
tara:strand:- start:1615 stop:1935 length:321 start_codon:yes stop_codon:yes gene_type:complete